MANFVGVSLSCNQKSTTNPLVLSHPTDPNGAKKLVCGNNGQFWAIMFKLSQFWSN
ncbi:hypothetical protein AO372_0001 [Moraxella catarrhalis]|nr:hypothetical protein AO372_0001 [Moraxella catarrhalis]